MTSNKYLPDEPIVAIATPLVPSALGIVRCSGKNCIEMASQVFSRPNALKTAKGNTLVYGWVQDAKSKKPIDEVMAGVYRAPKSFTGEDMVEFFCHGGAAPMLGVYNALLQAGFKKAERGEYTFRAFINGKADLTKAEAVKEIIDARTDKSRSHAVGRLEGGVAKEIESIKKQLLNVIATLEVEIEYPEDEANIAESFDAEPLRAVETRLLRLANSWIAEKLYQDGATIVLCGKTNAGKSSLFNTILKEERAIVSDIRGTTRDWLESHASFDGIPVRLFDTAGLRETDDLIEKNGVERTKELIAKADILLYVVDATCPLDEEDGAFFKSDFFTNATDANAKTIILLNKCDRVNDNERKQFNTQSICAQIERIWISAKTAEGVADLSCAVQKILQKSTTQEGASTDFVGLGSERQKNAVQDALDSVRHALVVAQEGFTLDAAVQDIEDALNSLGEITGEVTPDEILESVFSSFCVGK